MTKRAQTSQGLGVPNRRSTFRLVALIGVPIIVGTTMAIRWPDAGENFYSAVSQVIATLFLAIAVEFFAREVAWKNTIDRIRTLALVALSWSGLFACMRALAGGQAGVTVGIAGAGVTAASVLVSLALYEHIRESNRGSAQGDAMATGVVLLLLGVPVLLLTLL